MLCQNCGKNEVNFRYTQIINGVKKEMALCDECAKSLGLEALDFNMPINFSNFLGDFFDDVSEPNFLPNFTKTDILQCNKCGTTYNEFIKTGKFGCSNCYNVFSNGLNNLLKNIHNSNTHVGRTSKWVKSLNENNIQSETKLENKEQTKEKDEKKINSKEEKIKKLNSELKQAIKEERYEDAAKIRDEIKNMEE